MCVYCKKINYHCREEVKKGTMVTVVSDYALRLPRRVETVSKLIKIYYESLCKIN